MKKTIIIIIAAVLLVAISVVTTVFVMSIVNGYGEDEETSTKGSADRTDENDRENEKTIIPDEGYKRLPENGNISCISGFGISEDNGVLANEFLKNCKYELVDFDKKSMIAKVNISVPQIVDELYVIIDRVVENNPDMEYDALKDLVSNEVSELLSSEDIGYDTLETELAVEKTEKGLYRILPDEELVQFVTGPLEEKRREYFGKMMEAMASEKE